MAPGVVDMVLEAVTVLEYALAEVAVVLMLRQLLNV